MPEFDIEGALQSIPAINGSEHLRSDEPELVGNVVGCLRTQFGVAEEKVFAWKVKAGARVEITFPCVDYTDANALLDAMMDAVYACQQRDRQIRNLTVSCSFVRFYLYR